MCSYRTGTAKNETAPNGFKTDQKKTKRRTNMTTLIKNFIADESGAVTVDWVVLTAAVVGMAMAAYTAISPSATDMNTRTSTQMTNFNPFQ